MSPIRISSIDDPRVAAFAALPQRTGEDGRFVVEGEWLVQRLCRSRFTVDAVLCGEAQLARVQSYVPASSPLYVMSKAAMHELLGFKFHRGVLASALRDPLRSVDGLISTSRDHWTMVGCPAIADPVNLGRILRLSAGFGAVGVMVTAGGADPYSRQSLRVSMGAALQMPVVITEDFYSDLARLRRETGCQVAASVVDPHALPLRGYDRPSRLFILFGSEGEGLSDEMRASSDVQLTVPMQSGIDSFNVADACAIFLYELCQRER